MQTSLRQQDLLLRIVEEYIDTARPVSSQMLEKKHDFGVCPATIRNEMQALTKTGYIFQPHTSAGRVPTDKGYRFFVDCLMEKQTKESGFDNTQIKKIFKQLNKDIFGLIEDLTEFLAQTSSGFALSYIFQKDFVAKNGWTELFNEPEFNKKDLALDFFGFLEDFEKGIKELKINSSVKTFIGMENPFRKTKDFSIILSKCNFPKRKQGVISILGPKRMNYNKNIGLVNFCANLLADL